MRFAKNNEDWISLVASKRGYVMRSGAIKRVERFLSSHHAHAEPFQTTPLLFDREEYDSLVAAGRLLLMAQQKILKFLLATQSRHDVSEMFDVSETISRFINWENLVVGDHCIARFDIVPERQGYWFCEINWDATVAGFEHFECMREYAEQLDWPLTRGQMPPHLSIVKLISRVASTLDLTNVAICDWSSYRNKGLFDFEILWQTVKTSLPNLDVRLLYEDNYPESWLSPENGSKTLFYRGFMISDMSDSGFMERVRTSKATIINTFESDIRSNKRWFAMFHDESFKHLLSEEERDVIRRYVPETVFVNESNLEYVLREKNRIVFKVNRSSGGNGVLVGAEYDAAALRDRLLDVGLDKWTAQKLIEAEQIKLPDDKREGLTDGRSVLGIYLIDDIPGGVSVRTSSTSRIVNVSQGSASCWWAIPLSASEKDNLISAVTAPRYEIAN